MSSTSLVITVNMPDDTEMEFEAACGSTFDQIGRAIEMGLEVNGVKSGEWSSLNVVISPPEPPKAAARPKLAIVR
jgi:hypothetical protein